MGVAAEDVDVVPGLDANAVALRLDVDRVFGGDQLQADAVFARLDSAGQHADCLAGVEAPLVTADELAVQAAHQADGLAVGHLQVLPCRDAHAALGADGNDSVGAVRQLIWARPYNL